MNSIIKLLTMLLVISIFLPGTASAQINFEKTGYYLSLGDSMAAGEGALPVTNGFVYRLYGQGVFGRTQDMDFANIAIKGITTDELQGLQVPQALCIQPPRIAVAPSVITLSVGANDFLVFLADPQADYSQIPAVAAAIADKVANIIRSLVFGMPGLPPYCAGSGIPGITVLVSNYYKFEHPDPTVKSLLDLALESFDDRMRYDVGQIQDEIAIFEKTAKVGYVDTMSALEGRKGMLLIEKRNGYSNPFDFEIHLTNAGHNAIAAEFAKVWKSFQ